MEQIFKRTKSLKKKGQINDMIFVLVTLTVLALTMLIAGYVYFQIEPAINDPDIATDESKEAYDAFGVAFPIFDTSFLFITIGLILGLIVSSLFIPTSPVFLVINIIGFIILVFLGAVFANLYGDFMEQDTGDNMSMVSIAEENYPITTFVMQYLPYFGAGIIFILSIVMYAKGRLGDEY